MALSYLDALDALSEREVEALRTEIKNATFHMRHATSMSGAPTAVAIEAGATLESLTVYLRTRFPRRGSTPPHPGVSL